MSFESIGLEREAYFDVHTRQLEIPLSRLLRCNAEKRSGAWNINPLLTTFVEFVRMQQERRRALFETQIHYAAILDPALLVLLLLGATLPAGKAIYRASAPIKFAIALTPEHAVVDSPTRRTLH